MRFRVVRMSRVRLIALTATLASLGPATTSFAVDFRTPGRAAYCDYIAKGDPDEGGPARRSYIFCWTPNDGFFVQMTTRGKVIKGYSDDQLKGSYAPRTPVLTFGSRFRRGSFVCTSRSTGLDCVNAGGHGWHLGRYVGYRIY